MVFALPRQGLEPTKYCIGGEHANHSITMFLIVSFGNLALTLFGIVLKHDPPPHTHTHCPFHFYAAAMRSTTNARLINEKHFHILCLIEMTNLSIMHIIKNKYTSNKINV